MIALGTRLTVVLAVKPTHRGFGWVAFEGPFAPYDWGIIEKRRKRHEGSLAALERLIERLHPESLLLEAFERPSSTRIDRTQRTCRAMVALAADRGVDVEIYTRGDVRACFAAVGARTRDEIAAAVARHVDAFRHRLPKRRRPWEGSDRRMALFSAAALVLTHYQLGASRVFEDLKLDL
jgi:Holliday junction resolvasome RuvABC endonuclease subunit